MKPSFFSQKKIWIFCFFVAIALPFFLFLGRDSIQIWDEARNTMNLYEMYKNGNFLVTTYQGYPDMWNTKPPLLHWIQLFFVNILGFNELAIRLPSAISGILTCVILWYFIKKYTNNLPFAFFSAFVLATSNGFIDLHSSRTADYDTLLVLFTTITSLSLFIYIETKNNKYLYFFFISLALGVLTKSIAILLLLPAYGLFILFDKKVLTFLKNKHFYIGLAVFTILISSFYLLRENYNPGYLKTVFENEIFGRYTKGLEGNSRPFNFYFENFKTRFFWWFFFLPIGVFVGLLSKNIKYVRIIVFSLIIVISHFLIISSAETKLPWYELPEYPFLSIIVALGLYVIYDFLRKNSDFAITILNTYRAKKVLIVLFFASLMIIPYYKMMAKISTDKQEEYFRNNQIIPRYLKEVLYEKRNIEDDVCICVSMLNHHYHTEYYILRLQEKGKNIRFCDWKNINEGQIILIGHDDWLKEVIESHYEFEILEHHQSDWNYWGIKKYLIKQKIKEFD